MDKNIPVSETMKVVDILKPLSSEDRARVMRAAMVLLGDDGSKDSSTQIVGEGRGGPIDEIGTLPPRARAWMKQNNISGMQLQQIFHIAEGVVEVIAAHVPGRNKKEQTYNAYVLTGLGQLLLAGNPTFQDKAARGLCEASGCYDSGNHSAHLKDRGNQFVGSKDKGWVLTAPGLTRAAEIVRELTNQTT
jgi:hypothetical protein